MLQKLRDKTQSRGFKILVGTIIFVLCVFGFGAFNIFIDSNPEVASVNGYEIGQNEFANEVNRQQNQYIAQGISADAIDSLQLQASVLDRMISQRLLLQATDDLELGVSATQLNEVLQNDPSFQTDGVFDKAIYRDALGRMGYSSKEYLETIEESLAINELNTALVGTPLLMEWEFQAMASLLAQKRDIAYLTFSPSELTEAVEVSEELLASHYQSNLQDYTTQETLSASYVEYTLADLLSAEEIDVTEEDIVSEYDATLVELESSERRRAAHILLQVSDERPVEEAHLVLQYAKARIEGGEEFASVAEELSEDPGSASNGGDLGLVQRGVFTPEFDRVLFSLEEGELSDFVQTEFGVHLIRLEEIEIQEQPTLESLRSELQARIRNRRGLREFETALTTLDEMAFNDANLENIASSYNIEIHEQSSISTGTGEGVFAFAALREAVFVDDVVTQGFNTRAVQLEEGRIVVARMIDRQLSEQKALADVRDEVDAVVRNRLAESLAHENSLAALAQLQAGDGVSDVANSFNLRWESHAQAARATANVPRVVLTKAFELPPPLEGEKSLAIVNLAGGARAVVTVTEVYDTDPQTLSAAEQNGIRSQMLTLAGRLDFQGLFDTLEDEASISRR